MQKGISLRAGGDKACHRVYNEGIVSSAAGSEACGQTRREIRCEDAILRRLQVIRCAMKVDDLPFRIEQYERSAPVAVARLPYRSGINQVTSLRLQLQWHRLSPSHGPVFRAETISAVTVGKKSSLQMRVAKKSQGRGQREQRHQSIAD